MKIKVKDGISTIFIAGKYYQVVNGVVDIPKELFEKIKNEWFYVGEVEEKRDAIIDVPKIEARSELKKIGGK